jgi:hypothetical protein
MGTAFDDGFMRELHLSTRPGKAPEASTVCICIECRFGTATTTDAELTVITQSGQASVGKAHSEER